MKLNILYLLIGVALSISSKIIQFRGKSKIGDLIVILAAIFFILALFYSIPRFQQLMQQEQTRASGFILLFFSCLTVVIFQLMMIVSVGYSQKNGIIFFIIPLIISGAISMSLIWMNLLR